MKKLVFLTLLCFIANAFSQNPYDVKASSSDSKSSSLKLSLEEKLVNDSFPYIHISDWHKGMRFIVEPYNSTTPEIFGLNIFSADEGVTILQSKFEWKLFTVLSVEENMLNNKIGVDIVFDCEGKQYVYRYKFGTLQALRNSNDRTNIRHLVYVDEIDKAKRLFLNKKLYVLSKQWLEEKEDGGVYTWKQKYIPVTITKIGLGNSDGPVKMVFKGNDGNEYYRNVRFSGTNKSGSGVFGIDFSKFFSLSDPKLKYPNITPVNWKLIQNGEVVKGMTKQECILSWGEPESINKTSGSWGIHEQWVYGTNSYLYFENGKLTSIQN